MLVITGAGERVLRRLGPRRTPPTDDGSATGTSSAPTSTTRPGECGYTRRVDVFKPVIAAVNGYAFAAGLETALLADIRIAAENAEFGALERRWNIVGGDGMTVRLPLVVGFAKAMELIITGRPVDARGGGADRARQRGRADGQGARARAGAGARDRRAAPGRDPLRQGDDGARTSAARYEERLRIEAEMTISMFMRRDSHTIGARRVQARAASPEWPHHGL